MLQYRAAQIVGAVAVEPSEEGHGQLMTRREKSAITKYMVVYCLRYLRKEVSKEVSKEVGGQISTHLYLASYTPLLVTTHRHLR